MAIKSPCYGCQRRWATSEDSCHSSCEDYKAFAQARVERSRAIYKKRAEEAMVTDVCVRSIVRKQKAANANKQKAWRK